MKAPSQFTSIGGQAVIEGVMMRSPGYLALAIRKPNQRILVRHWPYVSWSLRYPLLKKPILRGVATLFESMIQGMESLSFSASIAATSEQEENTEESLSSWAIVLSMGMAFVLGMGLFVALPHLLTVWILGQETWGLTAESPIFHLVDGLIKVLILLIYLYLISLMRDIHRVFQYHGAEHKSIAAFEAGDELTVENARKYSRQHPRCGTSFLLFLVLVSIFVFSAVFPILNLSELTGQPVLNHLGMVVVKILLIFPIAGIAYEFIKMCSCRMESPVFRAMIWPGLILQNLTTREPEDEQLEVALASLRQVLKREKSQLEPTNEEEEFEVGQLEELGLVQARVTEFPE